MSGFFKKLFNRITGRGQEPEKPVVEEEVKVAEPEALSAPHHHLSQNLSRSLSRSPSLRRNR